MSNEVILKKLEEADIPLFESWLDKEYIKKWFGDKEDGHDFKSLYGDVTEKNHTLKKAMEIIEKQS